MTSPVSRSVTISPWDDGRATLRLEYLDWGAGAPPVVLLHGVGLTAHTWDGVCTRLPDRYRWIAPDLRGHGESEWAPDGDYSLAAFVRDLRRLIDALELGRVALVGMSLGASVALTYAGLEPDRVRSLTLVDLALDLPTDGRNRIREFLNGPTVEDSIDAFVERALAFNPRRERSALRRSLLRNLRQTVDGRWTWKYDPEIVTSPTRMQEHRAASLLASAAAVTCPTLLVRGGASDVTTEAGTARFAAAFATATTATIEGASHNVQGDRPAELADVLDGFLAGPTA